MAILCGCFYTLLCWKPAPEQKIWEADATKAKKVLCCGCHPLDKCCRFWFPFTAIASWQGCDVILDFILAFVVPCYACCCWQPRPTQKIWGAGAGAPVVGQPQAAETTPLTADPE
ncbi:unnamed protein product [Amoebophrya sp. A120]|nr:unnamed protein product [Amoebophrya sp. A120]|eukprot:GSA120T00004675001.1